MTYPYKVASEELITAFEGIGYERKWIGSEWNGKILVGRHEPVHLGELQIWMLEKHGICVLIMLYSDGTFFPTVQETQKPCSLIPFESLPTCNHPLDALTAALFKAVEIVKERDGNE